MILDQLFLKGLDLLSRFGILGIYILVGFAQIFGFPSEISLPLAGMIFGFNLKTVIVSFIGDVTAAFLLIYAGKNLKIFLKGNLKMFSPKEIFLFRLIPIMRGSILPLSCDVEKKKLVPIIIITSFIWANVLTFVGSFLNAYKIAFFLEKGEHYILAIAISLIFYRSVRYIRKTLKK